MSFTDGPSDESETLIEQLESAQASLEEALANLEDAVATYEAKTRHSDTAPQVTDGEKGLQDGWITSDTTVALTDWR
jgi:hypothetical protein